ncbi:WYL domain-containing protein [Actinomyces sp. MRS3W]|uniref:helix-turn-helix transcriptional regulator n=1 Tax=Actinomyces sp. MRS3W TaxID=2800796 RepID=UPI0028FD44BD|nr:WYL domain-containing protein [Actinomyces sp. MRS3W]MDU0348978.1 WYL domain-containing protein [Actinomyces sp. MRS3W]
MARPSSTDRLVRLLALPAWVADHDGATFEEAAAHFRVSPETIREDVATLWVSGLPGGMPDDLVDFSAAAFEAGRLSLTEPLGLDRPVRLSHREAVALLLSLGVLGDVLAEDPEAAAPLHEARHALQQALGATPAPDPPADATHSDVLRTVRQALAQHRRLHLVYVSATDTRSERDVDPLELRSDGTHLTLQAWCLSARAERSFRVDRILSATLLEKTATAHRTARRRHAPASDSTSTTVTLDLKASGRWLVEQIPCEVVEERADGSARVRVRGRDQAWLVGLLLSTGTHLQAVAPDELLADAGAAARRALARDAAVYA